MDLLKFLTSASTLSCQHIPLGFLRASPECGLDLLLDKQTSGFLAVCEVLALLIAFPPTKLGGIFLFIESNLPDFINHYRNSEGRFRTIGVLSS